MTSGGYIYTDTCAKQDGEWIVGKVCCEELFSGNVSLCLFLYVGSPFGSFCVEEVWLRLTFEVN